MRGTLARLAHLDISLEAHHFSKDERMKERLSDRTFSRTDRAQLESEMVLSDE